MVVILTWVLVDGASQITWAPGIAGRLVIASVISTAGLLAAAAAWSAVIGSDLKLGVATLGATMPLRHLPLGGLAQVVGMAGLAKVTEEKSGTIAYTTPTVVAATAAGAAIVASPVLWNPTSPWWLKLLVAGSLVATALLAWRGHQLLRFGLRKLGRTDPGERKSWTIPIVWSAVAAAAASASFALLLPEAGRFSTVVAAFSASWLCGYLMVIAPAGLGVREGVLVLLIAGVPAPTVIATGLLHRLATLVGELVLFFVSWMLSKEWQSRTRDDSPDPAGDRP
jgi:glycosyltransferase 2 family protein